MKYRIVKKWGGYSIQYRSFWKWHDERGIGPEPAKSYRTLDDAKKELDLRKKIFNEKAVVVYTEP